MPPLLFQSFLLTSVFTSNFKRSTLSLNGARAAGGRASLFELVKVKFVHVVFGQETRSDGTSDTDWKKGRDGEVTRSHLALLFSKHSRMW